VTAPPIRSATRADVDLVAALIGDAFHDLPAAGWLVPDPQQRAAILAANVAILVEHALSYGQVHTVHDGGSVAGAAVWLDYTRDIPPPPNYDTRLAAACRRWTDRFRHLDTLFDTHHPARAHHHLAFLAVRPSRQRRRIGTALLHHHHAMLDRYHIGGYLEASSPASRDLYLRHGYHLHADPFDLPSGAQFWPMWRPPAPTPAEDVRR